MKRCKKRGEWTEHQTTTTLNKSFLQNKVYTQEVHHKKGEEVGAYALPKTWVLHHYANFLTWHKHRRGMRLCSVPDLQLEGLGTRGRRGGEEKPEASPSCSEVHTVFVLFSLPWRCDPAGRLGPSWGRWPPPALRWNCSAPGRPAWSRWCATALPHVPQCSLSPGCTSPARKWTETKPFSFHLNPFQTENIPSPDKKSISHLSHTTQ